MPVVASAKALGIRINALGKPVEDWGGRAEGVGKILRRIKGRHMSMFGNAFGFAGYGTPFLYCAEHGGGPTAAPRKALQGHITELLASPTRGHKKPFYAVKGGVLVGHPREGGFGLLPVEQHVRARHAVRLVNLVNQEHRQPENWGALARVQWEGKNAARVRWPFMGLLSAGVFREGMGAGVRHCVGARRPDGTALPQPLARLVRAFAGLPPLVDVGAKPLELGGWVSMAPLWGNPFLTERTPEGGLGGCLEGRGFWDLAGLDQLQFLGDLAPMRRVVEGPNLPAAGEPLLQGYVRCLSESPSFAGTALIRQRLDLLAAEVSAEWRAAAGTDEAKRLFFGRGRVVGGVGTMLMRRLGFARGGLRALGLTVREATELQLGPEREEKAERQRKYHALARGEAFVELLPGEAAEGKPEAEAVRDWLGRVWDSGHDNHTKEKTFLLVYDGYGTARRRRARGEKCSCGFVCPGREHHFWSCPVATAVLDAVRQGLPPGTGLRREHVWLGIAPACQIVTGVWHAVAIAAIEAMAKGRSRLIKVKLSQGQAAAAGGVGQAAAHAAASFWASLQNYVSMQQWPRVWVDQLAEDAPFLRSQGGALVVGAPGGTD
jgi:hypothetical protein